MQVTVKLFAFFRDGRFKEEGREYPAGTMVGDIVDELGIGRDEVGVVMINSLQRSLQSPIADGDIVAIFPMIGGG
ncbi:MAG TPA: MoaD/ThiS family protein [Desulfoprunum sp.]|nr:MoaD/ThiS family protein [Desulfoprunum sp.]